MTFIFLGSNLRSSVSFQVPSYYNSSEKEKDSPSLSSFKTKLRTTSFPGLFPSQIQWEKPWERG